MNPTECLDPKEGIFSDAHDLPKLGIKHWPGACNRIFMRPHEP